MGWVKTPEEVARIQRVLAQPRFTDAERLQVDFLTTPEFVRSVLPPGLEAAAEPIASASIGVFRSNCVGDFSGGSVALLARHGAVEAGYVLCMYMTTDHAIVFGREVFGEPKKQAKIELHRHGDHVRGFVERHGVQLIDVNASLGPARGPGTGRSATFNIKALPAADGNGLEGDAILTVAEFEAVSTERWDGTATLKFRSTPHDPLEEIPIVSIRGARLIRGDLNARARKLATIPAAAFLPYALGRTDDWSKLDTSLKARAAE
jgi:acetoacetate decarboxylase